MIISNHQIYNLLKSYNSGGIRSNSLEKAPAKTKTTDGLDKTQVSEEAKTFKMNMKAVQGASEVREDRVAELKEAIRTGNYAVSSGEIAEKMLVRALVDKLV